MQVRSKLGEVNAQFNGDNEAAEKWQNWVALDKSLYLASFVKCYIRGSSCATKTHYTTYIHQDSWQELGNEGCLWNTLSLYLEEMVHLQVFPENKGEISFNHCALGLRRLLYFRVSWQKFILTIYTAIKYPNIKFREARQTKRTFQLTNLPYHHSPELTVFFSCYHKAREVLLAQYMETCNLTWLKKLHVAIRLLLEIRGEIKVTYVWCVNGNLNHVIP